MYLQIPYFYVKKDSEFTMSGVDKYGVLNFLDYFLFEKFT